MRARLDSLPLIERACWRELDRACRERAHGWRVMTLATVKDGAADARSVVVREADETERRIVFYTDSRSPKVAQIAAQPRAVLVAWSAELAWQLRIETTLTITEEGLDVSSHWARVKLSPAVNDYLAALPPGTPVRAHTPERATRAFFAMVTARVTAIDWLELHPDGSRRARFSADGADWLTP